jgi:hypothetical protein
LPVAAAALGLTDRLTDHRPDSTPDAADGQEMRQLGITYRGGPLSPVLDVARPQPGDRAPDAPCHRPDGRPVRLFDVQRGTHWTAYGFDTTPPALGPAVRGFGIASTAGDGGDVVDGDGHARRAYSPRPGELVLVRPDGHVATRSTDPCDLATYLDGVLAHRVDGQRSTAQHGPDRER